MMDDELRIKVAELTGWAEIESRDEIHPNLIAPTGLPPDNWLMERNSIDDKGMRWELPNWPNDISAAWELVDYLRGLSLEISIVWDTLRGSGGPWFVDGYMADDDVSFVADSNEAPRAITRAFILAMEPNAD